MTAMLNVPILTSVMMRLVTRTTVRGTVEVDTMPTVVITAPHDEEGVEGVRLIKVH